MNIVYKNKEKVLNENEKNGVYYLTYPMFEETGMVKHAFSTRLGGVSKGGCSTMNLSFARGDSEEDVRENFRRMADVLEVEENDFAFSKQTHTTNVRVVTEKDRGKGLTKPLDYDDVDGLVTNVQGICLSTFYADCVPLFFVDPVKKAIGLSHSGWRGTVGKIGKKTVEKMQEEYGSNPKDILAAIGPSGLAWNSRQNRKENCGENAGGIRLKSKGYSCGNRPVYLSGLLRSQQRCNRGIQECICRKVLGGFIL